MYILIPNRGEDRRGEDLSGTYDGNFGALVLKLREEIKARHGRINSDSDFRSSKKVIAQITNKPLLRAEIAWGLNECSNTQTQIGSFVFFHGQRQGKTIYHRDYLRDEILHETATEQLSLSAF